MLRDFNFSELVVNTIFKHSNDSNSHIPQYQGPIL